MDSYYILSDKRVNPRLEAHFNCIFLDGKGFPTPNLFNQLEVIGNAKFQLKIKESEIGKIKDKLSIKIQNEESLFVISSNLKDVLIQLGDKLEFYPITLDRKEGKITDFYIVNILQEADAIDFRESKLIYWDESFDLVYNIDDLVLNEENIPKDYNIFLLKRIKGEVIVLSKRFKEELKKNNISGISFCEIKDFVI